MHAGSRGSTMMIMVSLSLIPCHPVPQHNCVLTPEHLRLQPHLPPNFLCGRTPRRVLFSTHLDPLIQGSRKSTMMPNLVEPDFLMAPFFPSNCPALFLRRNLPHTKCSFVIARSMTSWVASLTLSYWDSYLMTPVRILMFLPFGRSMLFACWLATLLCSSTRMIFGTILLPCPNKGG